MCVTTHEMKNNKPKKVMLESDKSKIIKLYGKQNLSKTKIAELLGYSQKQIAHILKSAGFPPARVTKVKRKYPMDENYFEIIDSHEKAYILGFLFADGYNSPCNQIKLVQSVRDIEHLKLIQNCIQPDKKHAIKILKCINKPPYSQQDSALLTFYCKKMCDDLTKLGCKQAKSLNCELPKINNLYMNSFLAGLSMGDGWICANSKNSFKYGLVGSKIMIKQIQNYLKNNLNIHLTISSKDKVDRGTIGGNIQIYKFLTWMFKDTPFLLKRKFKKYEQMAEYFSISRDNTRQQKIEIEKSYKESTNIIKRLKNLVR